MENLLRLLTGLAVLALALVGVSYVFPGTYRVERSIGIQAPTEIVFARVSDLRQWPSWTPWHERDPRMMTEWSTASSGAGAWQKWDGPEAGKGELKITLSEPPRRLVYDLHLEDFGLSSVGEILIEPEGREGVRVTWSDSGRLGLNPVNRWLGLFFDRLIGPDFKEGLERLKAASESAAARAEPPVAAPAPPTSESPAPKPEEEAAAMVEEAAAAPTSP